MPTVTYKVIEIEHNDRHEEVGQQVLYRGPLVNLALLAHEQPALVPFSEKILYQGSKHCYKGINWPEADPDGEGYEALQQRPIVSKLPPHSLSALEVSALGLLLRFFEAGVSLPDEPVIVVPPFTQKEVKRLKRLLYAVDRGEGKEESPETLNLRRLFQYFLMRIECELPSLEALLGAASSSAVLDE